MQIPGSHGQRSVSRRKLNEEQEEVEIRDGASFVFLSPLGIVTPKKALPFLFKLVDLSFCYQRVLTAPEQKVIMEE